MQLQDYTEAIGTAAAIITAVTYAPQVVKAYKSKSVGDLSIVMLLAVFVSVILWLTYGLLKDQFPTILANSIMLVFVVILLYFKATFKK